MPGKLKVRVLEGRNLPVMDRSSDTTDAYVEVKLGSVTQKTDVYRKSLNPQWNSEWFIFEVDDLDLQDEPLQVRIMDHDTYSANDAIGKVYVDLNPLLISTSQESIASNPTAELIAKYQYLSSMELYSYEVTVEFFCTEGIPIISGWLPVYDTMYGIRGEVNIIVKVDLFSDFNKFRQSSCGIKFFFCSGVPFGYKCVNILGFVEELVVNDDPEYQWIDKIRTPRASNEARQTLFFKLSGELQRRIGLKVLELGGNAVIGYRQSFDLEGDYGIVVRGLGSVVVLTVRPKCISTGLQDAAVSIFDAQSMPAPKDVADFVCPSNTSPKRVSRIRTTSGCVPICRTSHFQDTNLQSPTHSCKVTSSQQGVSINRRSSDSDLSVTPKGSLTGSGGSSSGKVGGAAANQYSLVNCSFDMMEFPFLSMKSFPPGFIINIGGTVSSKAVKLLDHSKAPEEVETRDSWWIQVRTEIKSHAKALSCNVILGYEEYTTMCDDVCILGASGTAAVVNTNYQDNEVHGKVFKDANEQKRDVDPVTRWIPSAKPQLASVNGKNPAGTVDDVTETNANTGKSKSASVEPSPNLLTCHMCHIPYSDLSLPFKVKIQKCAVCKKGRVPDILFTTLELPHNFPFIGRGCLVQAMVTRTRRDLKGEQNAKEISDALPFLEYEIYRQLYNKIKIRGMNMLFGLRVRVTIGEKLLLGIATATAVFAAPLPSMSEPKTVTAGGSSEDRKKRCEVQKKIHEILESVGENGGACESGSDDSDDEPSDTDLACGQKAAFILELDDLEDCEVIEHLVKWGGRNGICVVSTEEVAGVERSWRASNIQMFTKIWRCKIPQNLGNSQLNIYLDTLIQSLFFKVRKFRGCFITGLEINVELPEEDQMQVSLLGMISAHQRLPTSSNLLPNPQSQEEGELVFCMDALNNAENGVAKGKETALAEQQAASTNPSLHTSFRSVSSFYSSGSSLKSYSKFSYEPFGVELTPLSFVPASRIDHYLGNLNFFFIRESNSIRECGGLSGFIGGFVSEVLALVRSHVSAAGGNALTSFFLSECILYHNLHKNQGQCLINVGGDIVKLCYLDAHMESEAS